MKILITAGPTREPIDAVRYIGNKSSGKMGIALAHAATISGHDVTLLLGNGVCHCVLDEDSTIPTKKQIDRVYLFDSSAQLKQLLEAHWRDNDVLLMAAAVADYRPVCVIDGKMQRESGKQTVTVELQPTPDLVALAAQAKRPNQRVVAFALEEAHHLRERATQKMRSKGVDAIVANPLGTMESDSITAVLLKADSSHEEPGRMSKQDFAAWLVSKLDQL